MAVTPGNDWVLGDADMRILVTGVNGQVGGELMDLGIAGCELIPTDKATLDLADSASIDLSFKRITPDLVVNCAAYTAVDNAEDQPQIAWEINAKGPGHLARLCAEKNVPLVHISTDFVFDGLKDIPYVPDDSVCPLGAYGASKEAGERAIRDQCPSHVIVRTAWVFSARGNNFVKTMLRIGEKANQVRVVADQIGQPTSAYDIGQAIAVVVEKIRAGNKPWGTYHFCNRGPVTWYDFAQEIFAGVEETWGRKPAVEAISTAQYVTKARRPANSVLSTDSFEKEFDFEPRPWRLALADVMQELLSAKGGA